MDSHGQMLFTFMQEILETFKEVVEDRQFVEADDANSIKHEVQIQTVVDQQDARSSGSRRVRLIVNDRAGTEQKATSNQPEDVKRAIAPSSPSSIVSPVAKKRIRTLQTDTANHKESLDT